MSLESAGLTCFLDVDNLGQGKFSDELVTHLRGYVPCVEEEALLRAWASDRALSALPRGTRPACSARAIVLVWSHGCMDRFLDDRDSARQDFVRLEYSQVCHTGGLGLPRALQGATPSCHRR